MKALKKLTPHCMVRYENATFSGGVWESASKYYEDIMGAVNEAGIGGWLSCDLYAMTHKGYMNGCDYIEYGSYSEFCPELLKLLQKYQPQKSS